MAVIGFHDEAGFAPARTFLASFVPTAAAALERHLGRAVSEPIHVVLSDRATHERRFPPRAEEILDLVEPEAIDEITGEEPDEDPAPALNDRFPRVWYAHGVATRVAAAHLAPEDAAIGEPVIYLDVETIIDVADRLDLTDEAVLAAVAAHELSHVFRCHVDSPSAGTVTHGWFAEGDAQRDAWHVLTELLSLSLTARVAAWARAAQVRAASQQPPAYRRFPMGAEHATLARHQPAPTPDRWALRTPRAVWRLTRETFVEVPTSTERRNPHVGDLIFLHDGTNCSGPWVIVAIAADPRVRHPSDVAAVEREQEEYSYSTSTFAWLQLRRRDDLRAGAVPVDMQYDSVLWPRRIDHGRSVEAELTEDPETFAERHAADDLTHWNDMIEQDAAAGKPVDDLREHDPFDDWPPGPRRTPAT